MYSRYAANIWILEKSCNSHLLYVNYGSEIRCEDKDHNLDLDEIGFKSIQGTTITAVTCYQENMSL